MKMKVLAGFGGTIKAFFTAEMRREKGKVKVKVKVKGKGKGGVEKVNSRAYCHIISVDIFLFLLAR